MRHQKPAQSDGGEDQSVLYVRNRHCHEHMGVDQSHDSHMEAHLV